MAGQLLLASTPHLGDDLVGQAHGVELVDGDAHVGGAVAHRRVVPGEGIQGHLGGACAHCLVEAVQPVADQALGPALDQVDQPTGVEVDEAGGEARGRRKFVSSSPSRDSVGVGRSASTSSMWALVAFHAVRHDTRCSAATSAADRVRTALTITPRSGSVILALPATCSGAC